MEIKQERTNEGSDGTTLPGGTKIYFGPHNQNNVGVLDTATSAFSTIATTGDAASGNYKYGGGVVLGTIVYFTPRWHPSYGAHVEQPAWHDPGAG